MTDRSVFDPPGTSFEFNLPDPDALPPEAAAETETVPEASDLDLLRADLPNVKVDDVRLPVPGRDGYEVSYDTRISEPELEAWRKRSKSKNHTDGIDGIKLGALILANKCLGIWRQGKQLHDSTGDPLVFAHREFLDLLGTPSAAEAVKKFYDLDASIASVSKAVMRAAGWGDDLDPLDH